MIYISIKPEFTKLIEEGIKKYEFRNYLPKRGVKILYVYETAPTSALKYIFEVGEIIKYPHQIKEDNYLGHKRFNQGLSAKYAYEIKKVLLLKKPLLLKELRENFTFTPPQAYAYGERYLKLTKYMEKAKQEVIIDRG